MYTYIYGDLIVEPSITCAKLCVAQSDQLTVRALQRSKLKTKSQQPYSLSEDRLSMCVCINVCVYQCVCVSIKQRANSPTVSQKSAAMSAQALQCQHKRCVIGRYNLYTRAPRIYVIYHLCTNEISVIYSLCNL